MGYYADVSTDNINEVIRLLKTNAFKIKTISKMITLHYKNRRYYAVNEILLRNKLEEVYFDIEINGRKEKNNSFKISGDGFIVTNLIGSTAYNRSAGGPIILTQKAICITFLNADGPIRQFYLESFAWFYLGYILAVASDYPVVFFDGDIYF